MSKKIGIDKDLMNVLLIYIAIVLTTWALINNHQKNKIIEKLDKSLFQAKSIAVQVYNQNNIYIEMVASLNDHIDGLEFRIETLENQNKITNKY